MDTYPLASSSLRGMHRAVLSGLALATLGLGLASPPGRAYASSPETSGYTLTLEVRGLRSGDGKVVAGLFDSGEAFPRKGAGWVRGALSRSLADGRASVTFENLAPGTYAVAIFHDENDNDQLDTNFVGIPKEGVGASNDAVGRLGPPRWDEAKFQLASHTRTSATLKYY